MIAPPPKSSACGARIVCVVFILSALYLALQVALVDFAFATLAVPLVAPSSPLPALGFACNAPKQFDEEKAGVHTKDRLCDNRGPGTII